MQKRLQCHPARYGGHHCKQVKGMILDQCADGAHQAFIEQRQFPDVGERE
ncbi:rCG49042 [Rattus norvegicus]|uniref:RCG49042 n=1 Tax=Rattus norvegicus TaxID=10116 RepID=A6IGE6_RAT|nr:rCG49042 [Rattus norvegicus]